MNESLRDAYAEIHKKYEVLEKKPKLRDDLDEVTLKNPQLLLSEGYRQLNEKADDL
jgi:hypothetical protein